MQPCAGTGIVVTTGEPTGVAGGGEVGEMVTTGGLLSVHPLTIARIARVKRRMDNGPRVVLAMVSDIIGNKIYVQGHERKRQRTSSLAYQPRTADYCRGGPSWHSCYGVVLWILGK